nr:immunoglobulin heavy chain junction region [Macaca mulatta]
CVRQQSNLDHW